MKILIIDPDVNVCDSYRTMLGGINADISVCHTAEKALHILIHLQPDIVLLDLGLRKAASEIVLGFIRKHPHLANTQVIVISSDSELASHTARYWEANAWIQKPVSKAHLYGAIGAVTS
jgi:DNA-binding response OmpR family regulator